MIALQTMNKSTRNFFIFLASVILIGICYFAYQHYKPYPLGDPDRLQYIGKDDYGCWLVCDSNPASTYYYATDMPIDQTIAYFKKATIVEDPRQVGNEFLFGLGLTNGETTYTNLYINKTEIYESKPFLKQTNKKHILLVSSFKYQALKDSL